MSRNKRRSSITFSAPKQIELNTNNDSWYHSTVWYRDGAIIDSLWSEGTVENFDIVSSAPLAPWKFTIRTNSGTKIMVLTAPLSAHNIEFEFVKRRDETMDSSVIKDMTSLSYLNEPELLICLQKRYTDKNIYTNIGPILLAVNPFERLPIYGNDTLYLFNEGKTDAPPHIFKTADVTYTRMFVDKFNPEKRENQTVIVSGESGAGKTESTKHVLHYLAVKSSEIASEIESRENINNDIENQIVASNPILESIGNAKTTRNNNSSRFGKFIELQYTSDGYIEAGVIRTYMLETVRVTSQIAKERNFHIFYELCAGMEPKQKKSFGLTKLEDFVYTNQSGEMKRFDGESDSDNYAAFKDAMCTLDIEDSMQSCIEQVLAAVLHLGNIGFVDSSNVGEDKAEFTSDSRPHVDLVCNLLEIREAALVTAVARRSVSFVGNVVEKTLNAEAASFARHTVARFVYASLFQWIVVQINAAMASRRSLEPASFIGVLDIFGFEHFAKNSFEQLCINYTNEKLQDHFNYSVFKSEQEVYREEGLNWTFVNYPDNSVRLELLEHSTTGVFAVINEQMKIPKCNDDKLATALYQRCETHVFFVATKMQKAKSEFTIIHYAREVTYQTAGMLDKNRSETAQEIADLLSASRNPLVQELYGLLGSDAPVKSSRAPTATTAGGRGMPRIPSARFNAASRKSSGVEQKADGKKVAPKESVGKRHTSVAAHFAHQLSDLMAKIRTTRSHFVCCIKPNAEMKKQSFDVTMATNQLRCGGALGAIKVFRAGFSNRMSFEAFVTKFSALAFVMGKNVVTKEFEDALEIARATMSSQKWKTAASRLISIIPLVENVLNFTLNEYSASGIDIYAEMQMGISQIFLRATAFEYVERQLYRARNLTARRLQIRWKIWRQAKHLTVTSPGMMAAQMAMKYFGDYRRRSAIKKVVATIVLQRRARVFFAVRFRQTMLRSIRKLQVVARGFLFRATVRRKRNAAARVVQNVLKARHHRRRFLLLKRAIKLIQKRFRGSRARINVKIKIVRENKGKWAVLCLQSLFRGQRARRETQLIKRAKIAKKFDAQLKAAQKKQEMIDNFQKKLEANPNLLEEIATSATDVANLNKTIDTLRKKIAELENENSRLKKAAAFATAAANKPAQASSSMNINPNAEVSSDQYQRIYALESENSDLKRRLEEALSDVNSPRNATSSVLVDVPGVSAADKDSLAASPANTSSTTPVKARRATMTSQLSLSSDDIGGDDDHPDWVRKYSDQHKRVYWRHKVNGKTTWTQPAKAVAAIDSNAGSSKGKVSEADTNIAVERLIQGWLVTKLSNNHYPKERALVVDPSTQVLIWRKDTSPTSKIDSCVNLDAIKRITKGKKSRVLEKIKGVDENLCLSVHFLNTSLDLQLATETERDMMYEGLKSMTSV